MENEKVDIDKLFGNLTKPSEEEEEKKKQEYLKNKWPGIFIKK